MPKGISSQLAIKRQTAFSIVWGAISLAAYLISLNFFIPLINPKGNGLCFNQTLPFAITGTCQSPDNFAALYANSSTKLLLLSLPILALAIIGLSIALRVRPNSSTLVRSYLGVAIALLAVSTGVFFYTVIQKGGNNFEIAAIVVVASGIIVRLKNAIGDSFQQRPALSSLISLVIGYLTFLLANSLTFTAIVLSQINSWVLFGSAVLLTYSGYLIARRIGKQAHGK